MSRSIRINVKEELGRGSFGEVYKCQGPDGSMMAVKSTKLDAYGIQDLLEVSIMSTYKHPNLCHAIYSYVDYNYLYIFMESASSDLSNIIHTGDISKPFDLHIITSWCWQMTLGLACLHSINIIHADIKSNNILLMNDGSLKLTDFTLSTRAISKSDQYVHQCCTITHRPPECMLGGMWGFSADIWSLACTFYEVAARDLLVTNQTSKIPGFNNKIQEHKKMLKSKTLSSIIHWCQSREEPGSRSHNIADDDFIHICVNEKYQKMDPLFRDLMIRMMRFTPNDRLNVKDIIRHQYFQKMSTTPIPKCTIVSSRSYPMSEGDISIIEKAISEHNPTIEVMAKTKEILSRCVKMANWNSYNNILGAFWIATKIITGTHPQVTNVQTHNVKDAERRICLHLHFSLHRASGKNIL